MGWVVTPAMLALRSAFNVRFPDRDRRTDGTIGDATHQLSPSGHNPDDTPGSLPESHDADSIAEVRAVDVDADLNEPGVTMRDVVERIVTSAADRQRLLYVIHDRDIWTRSNKWKPTIYRGDPHLSHAHFSGDPEWDHEGFEWTSVTRFKLPDPTPPAPATHKPGSRMLYLTSPMLRGEDVTYIQKFIGLRKCGPADGIFGPHTREGVLWYQRMRGITVDGIVGPVTWRNMRVTWTG